MLLPRASPACRNHNASNRRAESPEVKNTAQIKGVMGAPPSRTIDPDVLRDDDEPVAREAIASR